MNRLFEALLEKEVKSIFGDLCTNIYVNEMYDTIFVRIGNLGKNREEGRQLANIVISITNPELKEAKFPLDLFKVKVTNACISMKEFLKAEKVA